MRFSCNGWPYVHLGNSLSFTDVIRHINRCGINGFDFCIGKDAYPKIQFDATLEEIYEVSETMDDISSYTASIVLISYPLDSVDEMVHQLKIGSFLARIMDAPRLHLLPRKNGISCIQAWINFIKAWDTAGYVPKRQGLPVSVENHTTSEDPENDVFLFRSSMDLIDLIDRMNGEIRIKYDPAWLMKAGDDPFDLLPQLIDHIEILDLKDYADGRFVTPGTGDLDFKRLANAFNERKLQIPDISVEVEEHHYFKQDVTDVNIIDPLIVNAREFYEIIF